jgi:hypothetical protein
MADTPSKKAQAWVLFDEVVGRAAVNGHTNPWKIDSAGVGHYAVDYDTLHALLGIALHLKAPTTSGVPALALDVWVAYELRRAGFDENAVWPRATAPRVYPTVITSLLKGLTKKESAPITEKIASGKTIAGAVASSAKILGKNYVKQVDVVMSSWETGPEIMISTKRMDSSFGKNAANRVEESYGDAKNLRSRHPQSALGFVYGLRSTVLNENGPTADWIKDLLQKLGREDDAYDAVTLLMLDYSSDSPIEPDDFGDGENAKAEAGLEPDTSLDEDEELSEISDEELNDTLANLPVVSVLLNEVPPLLRPEHFFATMVSRVLDNSPVTFHSGARAKRTNPVLLG